MQPSRRAFLLGRRPSRSGWDELRLRLSRAADGGLDDTGPGRALLTPRGPADVRLARGLCVEHGAVLALAGTDAAVAPSPRPVLVVDPARLDGLVREGAGWYAEPGCRMGELARAGLARYAGAPPEMLLAQWLARPHGWSAGGTAASGVATLDLLLADGTAETFGPFGEADVRPLQSVATQRLVPALFQLAGGADAAACLAATAWPARHRLDALRPRAPHGVNLAHLLLGHGGVLAWVEGATLHGNAQADAVAGSDAIAASAGREPRPAPAVVTDASADALSAHAVDSSLQDAARRLDAAVVRLFDPRGVYGAAQADPA